MFSRHTLLAAGLTALAILIITVDGQNVTTAPATAPTTALPVNASSNVTTFPVNPSSNKPFTNAQVIIDINNLAQGAVRQFGIQNQLSGKVYALTHIAALTAIQNTKGTAAQQQAAAAYAAAAVLDGLFPWRFYVNEQPIINNYTRNLTASEKNKAQEAGTAAAVDALEQGVGDGFVEFPSWFTGYNASTAQPGQYIFVPGQTYYLYPQLARTTPILVNSSAFVGSLKVPYELTSAQFAAALNETYTLGGNSSTARTQYQTDTANFWADGNTTSSVVGHFNTIAQIVLPADISLLDAAKAFSQINAAVWDASIPGWQQKYNILFWRPITAIRSSYTQSSNSLQSSYNANWTSYLSTPPHPEYPSGHSISAGAAAGVIAKYVGDNVTFTVGTEFRNAAGNGLPPRTYKSLTEAVQEVGESRVYAGVHFRAAIVDGAALGKNVADKLYSSWGGSALPPAVSVSG